MIQLFTNIIVSIRPIHQIKNLLVFTTFVSSKSFKNFNIEIIYITFLGFIIFSITSGAIYIMNDIIDKKKDLLHPEKSNRPIASGKLTKINGVLFIIFFLLLSFFLIYLINFPNKTDMLLCLFAYVILNIFYSYYLKNIFFLDLILLIIFYNIRILFGSLSNNIIISEWLIYFSSALFFSLSLLKRYIEIKFNKNSIIPYKRNILNLIFIIGIFSSFLSSATIYLYSYSEKALKLYNVTDLLCLSIIIFFWLVLLWIKARNKLISYDVVKYAIYRKENIFFIILCIFFILK